MTGLNIVLDSPYLSPEEFSRRTGTPIRTVQKRIQSGELPADSLTLDANKVGGSTKYINMVKLYQMAASSSFVHPRLRP
tara:strand:+ start:1585 stop:1821 length:237 start_codon:yes stop_codon:yes gene_type:complete